MSNPFETDWSNVGLDRESHLSLIDGMTFQELLLEIETGSVGDIVDRDTLSKHFEKRLREITSEAREIFAMNVDNIIAYANRHAIAEALEAEREAKDQEVLNQILLDFHANARVWRPISQEKFNYMLECLPPIRRGRGGFVNSEAWSSLCDGEEVYFVALKGNGQCYATLGTLAEWDSKALDLMYDIEKW